RLLVQRSVGPLDRAFTSFELGYELPELYTAAPPAAEPEPEAAPTAGPVAPGASASGQWELFEDAEETPLWVRIWESKTVAIGMLVLMLVTLTLIFFFQDILVK